MWVEGGFGQVLGRVLGSRSAVSFRVVEISTKTKFPSHFIFPIFREFLVTSDCSQIFLSLIYVVSPFNLAKNEGQISVMVLGLRLHFQRCRTSTMLAY